MDPFSWIGDQVSSGVDWLFSGNNALNTATDGLKAYSASSSPGGSASVQGLSGLMNAVRAKDPPRGDTPGIRTTQVASKRPAEVHTMDRPLFRNVPQNDPWMYSFRSIINRGQNIAQQAAP